MCHVHVRSHMDTATDVCDTLLRHFGGVLVHQPSVFSRYRVKREHGKYEWKKWREKYYY